MSQIRKHYGLPKAFLPPTPPSLTVLGWQTPLKPSRTKPLVHIPSLQSQIRSDKPTRSDKARSRNYRPREKKVKHENSTLSQNSSSEFESKMLPEPNLPSHLPLGLGPWETHTSLGSSTISSESTSPPESPILLSEPTRSNRPGRKKANKEDAELGITSTSLFEWKMAPEPSSCLPSSPPVSPIPWEALTYIGSNVIPVSTSPPQSPVPLDKFTRSAKARSQNLRRAMRKKRKPPQSEFTQTPIPPSPPFTPAKKGKGGRRSVRGISNSKLNTEEWGVFDGFDEE